MQCRDVISQYLSQSIHARCQFNRQKISDQTERTPTQQEPSLSSPTQPSLLSSAEYALSQVSLYFSLIQTSWVSGVLQQPCRFNERTSWVAKARRASPTSKRCTEFVSEISPPWSCKGGIFPPTQAEHAEGRKNRWSWCVAHSHVCTEIERCMHRGDRDVYTSQPRVPLHRLSEWND